jgi:hypothetical protein
LAKGLAFLPHKSWVSKRGMDGKKKKKKRGTDGKKKKRGIVNTDPQGEVRQPVSYL